MKNFMTFDFDFTGIRLQDKYLTPVDWNLSVDLFAVEKTGQTKSDIEASAGFIFQKIYFWLSTNLPGILTVDVTDEEDLFLANITSNIMMFCPGSPTDDLIIRLLHAKLTSLSDGSLIIGPVRLKASDTSLCYNYDCMDGEYNLPSTTEEYYTEHPCKDQAPWWTRDDGFCFEFAKAETEEMIKISESIVDPMEEFYSIINEYSSISKEPAKIIKPERWNPKKV